MTEKNVRVLMSRLGDCVDLGGTFGDQYKISRDESYFVEKPELRSSAGSWFDIIPCRFGHIYPHGGQMLAVYSSSHSRRLQLAALNCACLYVEADRETIVLFDVVYFARVAEIVQPRRRRRLSPDQRTACTKRLAAFRFQPKTIARQDEFCMQGREEMKPEDPNCVRQADVV